MIIIRHFIHSLRLPRSIVFSNRRTIIFDLFKKKNQQESKASEQPSQTLQENEQEEDDQQYNFFERRKEIDTEMDFSKLRGTNSQLIPQDLSKAGLEEILYWSQNIKSPEEVRDFTFIFNNLAERNKRQVQENLKNVQLLQFKNNVVSTVYLTDSLRYLHQYSLFAYIYGIKQPEFWQKIQFKAMKYDPKNQEQTTQIIDIALIMGQLEQGQLIFNYLQKILVTYQFNVEQNIKLFLVFSNMKVGEKPFIDKLLKGISETIQHANAQLLATLLPNLRELKQMPSQLANNVQKRALEVIQGFTFPQLLKLAHYLGFQNKNDTLWTRIQERLKIYLSSKKISYKILIQLIHKCMLTYKFTLQFIREFIIKPIQAHTTQILEEMSPQTLSSLSKGLYIYELENETKHIQEQIGKILIVKISNAINQLSDEQLIKVIQDYNLTRHGNREIYIFFEEVIKVKFIKYFNPDLNRNNVEKLIQIYENSGMCTREMFDALKNLILE